MTTPARFYMYMLLCFRPGEYWSAYLLTYHWSKERFAVVPLRRGWECQETHYSYSNNQAVRLALKRILYMYIRTCIILTCTCVSTCMYSGAFLSNLCNGKAILKITDVNIVIFTHYYVHETSGPTFHQCTVTAIESVSYDTQLFTLRQSSHTPLHIPTGQHIKIQAEIKGEFCARWGIFSFASIAMIVISSTYVYCILMCDFWTRRSRQGSS